MSYKIAKSIRLRLMVVCTLLLASAGLITGCVLSNPSAAQAALDEQPAPPLASSAKPTAQITAVSGNEAEGCYVVAIQSDAMLTYTSYKQPSPLAVDLFFPASVSDGVKATKIAANDLVENVDIESNPVATPATHLRILLKQDVPYTVERTGNGLQVRFAKPHAMEYTVGSMTYAKTENGASQVKSVSVKKVAAGIEVSVSADGQIANFKNFTVQNPPRIVIDMFGVKSSFEKEQKVPVQSEILSGVRYFGYPDRVRLVLDTQTPFLKTYAATSSPDGLLVKIMNNKVAESNITETSIPASNKPAWVKRLDFSSEEGGKSKIIIGTSHPVAYKVDKVSDQQLQLRLEGTNIPAHLVRPLITTRFDSAVNRVIPMQLSKVKNTALINIEMREMVPYHIEQTGDILMVDFEASSIPPQTIGRCCFARVESRDE